MNDPTGRAYRLRSTGELDLLFNGFAGPNGLVLNKEEISLYVAATRTNNIICIPLLPNRKGVGKMGMFIQLSGSPTGPDGMALGEDGSLVIVHAGFGTVWVFSPLGRPIYRIKSCAGMRTTNVAFGGEDRKTLFITEAQEGVILKAKLPFAGKKMYSHT
jgi:gluconolactonase